VIFQFQKILYRTKYFDYDARGQITLTCRCILESEGNEGAFREPFVSAVHSVCSKPAFAERGLELIEAFDQINLVGIIDDMKTLEYFLPKNVPSVVSQIVRNKIQRILTPPAPPPEPSTREQAEEAKQALAASRTKTIERRLDLGRRLAALRDVTPCNRTYSRAVDKFDLRHRHEVAELTRVARRYGSRPDITGKVRNWRALVALSSTLLPESRRQEFERRIAVGESVSAKAVAAAARG
jgi:hypothetical protein